MCCVFSGSWAFGFLFREVCGLLSVISNNSVCRDRIIRIYVLGAYSRDLYDVGTYGRVSAYLSNVAASSRAVFLVLGAL